MQGDPSCTQIEVTSQALHILRLNRVDSRRIVRQSAGGRGLFYVAWTWTPTRSGTLAPLERHSRHHGSDGGSWMIHRRQLGRRRVSRWHTGACTTASLRPQSTPRLVGGRHRRELNMQCNKFGRGKSLGCHTLPSLSISPSVGTRAAHSLTFSVSLSVCLSLSISLSVSLPLSLSLSLSCIDPVSSMYLRT